jgi:hypothetical protein
MDVTCSSSESPTVPGTASQKRDVDGRDLSPFRLSGRSVAAGRSALPRRCPQSFSAPLRVRCMKGSRRGSRIRRVRRPGERRSEGTATCSSTPTTPLELRTPDASARADWRASDLWLERTYVPFCRAVLRSSSSHFGGRSVRRSVRCNDPREQVSQGPPIPRARWRFR